MTLDQAKKMTAMAQGLYSGETSVRELPTAIQQPGTVSPKGKVAPGTPGVDIVLGAPAAPKPRSHKKAVPFSKVAPPDLARIFAAGTTEKPAGTEKPQLPSVRAMAAAQEVEPPVPAPGQKSEPKPKPSFQSLFGKKKPNIAGLFGGENK
jgi:hypothetical protein